MSALTTMPNRDADPSLVTYTHVVYALHAASLIVGVVGSATIIGSFLLSVPSILAVVMNYVRKADAAGTWLDSHFRWQIRTFWYALAAVCVAGAACLPFVLLFGLGVLMFAGCAAVIGLWVLYRVVRGWLALGSSQSLPLP